METRKRSAILLDFAQRLGPNEEEKRSGNEAIEYLRNLISKKIKSTSVARSVPSGSYQRKTAISGHYDIDITFFFEMSIDNFSRHRAALCDEMEDILEEEGIFVKKNTKRSVRCEMNGIKYDLVTAISLYPNDWRQQYNEILRIVAKQNTMNEKKEMHHLLTSSKCEAINYFMAATDSYTHCLCRLAKYWMFNRLPNEHFSGKSSTIELLAVRAAEMTLEDQDILAGYRQFLTILSEIKKQRIIWDTYYDQDKISNLIRSNNPLLLDPCNPFNNRLYCFIKRPNLATTFMTAANQSLEILDDWEKSYNDDPQYLFKARQTNGSSRQTINSYNEQINENYLIENIPQPTVIDDDNDFFKIPGTRCRCIIL